MTPSIPALRAALAASAGEWPWEAVEEIVYGADGQVVAEFAHDDGEPEAVLAALAVNALPTLLDRLEKADALAEEARTFLDPHVGKALNRAFTNGSELVRDLRKAVYAYEDSALTKMEAPDGR